MKFSVELLLLFNFVLPLNNGIKHNINIVKSDTATIDKMFVDWNKATLKSGKRQIDSTEDGYTAKKMLKSWLIAFKQFIEIQEPEKVNRHSIRYEFLNEVIDRITTDKEFYIIESNLSGQTSIIRNFVVYPIVKDTSIVETFFYPDDKWKKKIETKRLYLYFGSKFIDNLSIYI